MASAQALVALLLATLANGSNGLPSVARAPQISSHAYAGKRGLSGLSTCKDALTLNLQDTWYYNWGPNPEPLAMYGAPCAEPAAREFVPMIWGCYGNCTRGVSDGVLESWKRHGVRYLLGFNEPDNPGQSNLAPQKAAMFWPQLEALAARFDPPLQLVGPGMTHWTDEGGSPWLDQFLGNLSTTSVANIKFFAFHDYSGNPKAIVTKAEAVFKKYNKQSWITEFAVGSGKDRDINNAFVKKALPLLDASSAVARYAWFSTRNVPASWVNASSLLPFETWGWKKIPRTACADMTFLTQHVTAGACKLAALDNPKCASPTTVMYESGDVQNCYCANTTVCKHVASSWLDMFVDHTPPGLSWTTDSHTSCQPGQLLELAISKLLSAAACKRAVLADDTCARPAKAVFDSTVGSCSCANTTCTHTTAPSATLYSSNVWPSLTPTSTGMLYKGDQHTQQQPKQLPPNTRR
eukprot:m.54987 g.54987  ORF g.54987 m.54987 type:complete len:465 (+) comp12498_c0_seq2:17-1411(+)